MVSGEGESVELPAAVAVGDGAEVWLARLAQVGAGAGLRALMQVLASLGRFEQGIHWESDSGCRFGQVFNPFCVPLTPSPQAMRAALQRGFASAASGALGGALFEAAPAQVLGLLHAVDFTSRRACRPRLA
jgi:hypothetical protein